MKSKMMASRQYTANMFGMSNGDPGKRQARQERRDARQATRGGSKSNDNVEVCTAKTAKEGKCGAYAGGGPSTGTVQKAKNTKPSSGGEKNVVLKEGSRKLARHQRNLAKVREKAPARPMTRKEKEKASVMGPPTPSYVTDKKTKPKAEPKKLKATF
jgi:hypothetical protein